MKKENINSLADAHYYIKTRKSKNKQKKAKKYFENKFGFV